MLKKDKLIDNKLYPNLIAYILGFGIPIYAVINFDSLKESIGIFFALLVLPLAGLGLYAYRSYRYIDIDEEDADSSVDDAFIAQNKNRADSLFDNTKYLDKQFLYFTLTMLFGFVIISVSSKQFELSFLILSLSLAVLFFIIGAFNYIARVEFRNMGIQIDSYSKVRFGIGKNIFIPYEKVSFLNSLSDIQIFVDRKFTNYALQLWYWDKELFIDVIGEIQKRLPKSQYELGRGLTSRSSRRRNR